MIFVTTKLTWTFVDKNKDDALQINYRAFHDIHVRQRQKIESLRNFTENKGKIIYMNNPAHWLDDWLGNSWETSDLFKACDVSKCLLSKDETAFNLSDVVVIRPFDLKTCIKKRRNGQVWIFMEHESPKSFDPAHKGMQECYRNMFNWTFTYRRDSDFTLVHGYFKPNKGRSRIDLSRLEQDIKSKTRNAVGFISNCNVSSQRDIFAQELNATGLNLDIVGGCGNLKCRNDNRHKTSWNTTGAKNECFDVLNSKYKFYLSFENALCADYVTEKSLNLIMSRNIVPVIRDGVNHSLYHPPGSYIHTSEFANVQKLVSHLLGIANNKARYREYFNWRKHYAVHGIIDILQQTFCEICKRSHNLDKYHRIYDDVGKYVWDYAGNPACLSPTDIKQRP